MRREVDFLCLKRLCLTGLVLIEPLRGNVITVSDAVAHT